MLSEGDWVVLKLAIQNLRSPVDHNELVNRESVLRLLECWVEETIVTEIYQKALKQIATNPCLSPEGNAKLAQTALNTVS